MFSISNNVASENQTSQISEESATGSGQNQSVVPCDGLLCQVVRKTVVTTTDVFNLFTPGKFDYKQSDRHFQVVAPDSLSEIEYNQSQFEQAQQEAHTRSINRVHKTAVRWREPVGTPEDENSMSSDSHFVPPYNSDEDPDVFFEDDELGSQSSASRSLDNITSQPNNNQELISPVEIDELTQEDLENLSSGTVNIDLDSD